MANNFSKDELRNDYKLLADYATNQEKKELSAKYGVDSKKAKDIQNVILVQLHNIRLTDNAFNNDDVHDFMRMWETDKQFMEYLKTESIQFITYLRDYLFNNLKSRKLDKWADAKIGRGMLSPADTYKIKQYQKVNEYLESQNPMVQAQQIFDKNILDRLNAKFSEELKDFKIEYLKKVENYANEVYDNIPARIEKFILIINNIKAELNKAYNWELKTKLIRYENTLNSKKGLLVKYPTKQDYVNKCITDAKNVFNDNINALSHRIYDKGFTIDNIKVSNVHDDPKIFQMIISDGTQKLFCRSILAAVNSDKMIPHFRFIMTDRK